MSNGRLLEELRSMAEKQQISGKVAFPVIFAALADIMESQNRIIESARVESERLAHNPMIRVGEAIARKPAKIAACVVIAVLVINTIGPMVLTALGIDVPLDGLKIIP